jgi:hypothetical protein
LQPNLEVFPPKPKAARVEELAREAGKSDFPAGVEPEISASARITLDQKRNSLQSSPLRAPFSNA